MTIKLPQTVRYVLDTDSVTYQQLGRDAIVQRLAQLPADDVATTIVTMYEQLRGRLAAINRNQSEQELQLTSQRLQLTLAYYCRVLVLPFDAAAAMLYRDLVKQKLRIGAEDLKIAAIVLAHHATLVTSNRRHFDQVPGLQVEDWNRT
jgi:tRNA(fMet)-specific endonuclease VapC